MSENERQANRSVGSGGGLGGSQTIPDLDRKDESRGDYITRLVSYKRPTDEKNAKYSALRLKAADYIKAIDELCPPSADRTHAVRQAQDSLMTANRSIANDGESYR